jgi:elongation factor G
MDTTKTFASADIRNVAVVGHASCGKTMLSESALVCGGEINRMGSIANGSTVSDYHDSEVEHQISVQTTMMHLEWLGKKVNLFDAPGYLDFTGEAISALRVADCALVAVHANHGLGAGTDRVWKVATQFGVPKILVLNALDKEQVDFARSLAELRARFGERVLPLCVPLNAGPGFNQVLDVLRSEVVTYAGDRSGQYTESPASGAAREQVDTLHKQLMEYVAESDDALLEQFFDKGSLTEEEMRGGLHAAVARQSFIPLFCTSGENNVGVARLLDFIAKYGPAPTDRPKARGVDANDAEIEVALTDPDPVCLIYKTMNEAQFGEMSFFRVYGGTLRAGTELYNSNRRVSEKIGQIYVVNGKQRATVGSLSAGDVGALVKLKDTHTGNTLCGGRKAVTLPPIEFPKPNIHASLKLHTKGEEDKIAEGLSALHDEDPTFLFVVDGELHQTVISGQGDMHLQIATERLKRRYKVEIELVEPRVRYRETIKAKADSKYRHKKQTGGAGQFAEVWMRIEPKPRDTGVEFTQSLTGQNVDRVFVPSVEKGVMAACNEGVIAGYRIVDVKVDFYDGKMHPVDSKDIAFQIAGKEAFKEAFQAARPCLLEPILTVEVRVPEDSMGNVIGDLSSRRGKILGMDSADGMQVVKAQVPQKELYRYASVLRSLTGGRGLHTEEFSHYEEMPRELEQKVIEASKKAKAEEKS